MHSKQIAAIIAAVLMITTSAGCFWHAEPVQMPEDTPEAQPAPGGAEVGGDMIFGTTETLQDTNPLLSSDVHTHFVSRQVYAGLVRAGEDLKMQPYVAAGWEFSDDGRTWTFHLRDDVFFHDGEQLTASDVQFTYSLLQHPDFPGVLGPQYEVIEQVSVEGELTVVFHLTRAHAPLLSHLELGILPEHLFEQHEVSQLEEAAAEHPVGAGPYRQTSINDDRVVLQRNPDFFLPGPFIEQIRVESYDDEQSMMQALREEEIDYMGVVPPEQVQGLKDEHGGALDFYRRQHNGYMYLGLNQTDPLLADQKVRQALMHGIDRQALVEQVLDGQGVVINSHVPAFSWAHHPELPAYEYEPDRAEQLLAEAGWTDVDEDGIRKDADGQRLSITCLTAAGSIEREQLLSHIQSDLSEVGVELQYRILDWDTLLREHVEAGNFQSYLLGWALEIDPDPYLYFHSEASLDDEGLLVGFNDVQFSNDRADELLDTGRTTLNYEHRTEVYRELQEILNQQLPYVFLYSRTLTTAVNSDIQGMVIGDVGPLFTERWYIKTAGDD